MKENLIKRFTKYMGNKKILLPLACLLSGASALFQILPFIFIWKILKNILSMGELNIELIKIYSVLSIISALFAQILYYISLTCSHLASFRVEVGIQKVSMEKVMNMPLGFFDLNPSGKIRKVINDGASETHSFLAHQMPDLAGTIVAPIMIIGLMFYIDWKMGLISFIPVILAMISMSFMTSKEGKKFQDQYYNSLEVMSSEAVEYVRGIPVVKTFGQSIFSFKKFYNSIVSYRDMVHKYTLLWKKPMAKFIVLIEGAGLFLVPGFLIMIKNGGMVGETLADFIFYITIIPSLTSLIMKNMYFQQKSSVAKQAIDRIDEMLKYPEMKFDEKNCTLKNNTIEFKNVTFSYPNTEKPAIKNISFTVNEGETLALVGASGSGKTTVARLAARFWDIESGDILIGGISIKQIPKKQLMENISFVFQNTKLLKGTIRENIIFGKKEVSEEEIQNSLKLSSSEEIIEKLPDGLETVIGSKGTYLSGGEQQRIALARGLLKDSPIVLLDEATAFADPENQHLIHMALKEISKNKTTLTIAHRLDTIKNADKILVLEKGEIVEIGTHKELIEKKGKYNEIWEEYNENLSWKVEKNDNRKEKKND